MLLNISSVFRKCFMLGVYYQYISHFDVVLYIPGKTRDISRVKSQHFTDADVVTPQPV